MSRPLDADEGSGPFTADQVKPGDRYEISDGHPIYAAPTGGDGARRTAFGVEVLETDPDVESAGVDAGFSPAPKVLCAPDIALGNVTDQPGWIRGVPPLAVEYASIGQDEVRLQAKIKDLLVAGTRWVWVVRLVGPRRVEVYEKDSPVRMLGHGETLRAPGILRNEVPVEALFDRDVAHGLTLRNLLQRRGYGSIDDVREEGREEGREEAAARAVLTVLEARGLAIDERMQTRILSCRDRPRIDAWLRLAATVETASDLFCDER